MPVRTNTNIYLEEVFKQFVAIQDADYKKSQAVFNAVFDAVRKCMGEKDNYFQKYGKQVMYAGSVYDGIKVSKLDEFDMNIVIRLPISYKDGPKGIILENDEPGFMRLKIGQAFDDLDNQKDWENCHKVTRGWRDSENYLLQNKFRDWIHGVVKKALNDMGGRVVVNGVTYLVTYKESGPAYTLKIKNDVGGENFALDVDLVPVIRFMLPRWPEGYRQVEHTRVKDWMLVPKPNKAQEDEVKRNRCWRPSFQEFERDMMKGCQLLKMTIRMVKKLRDALMLKSIASYYIKTLFLWKLESMKDKSFWEQKLIVIFTEMVQELRDAINKKNIPFFWNDKVNLIEFLPDTVQQEYVGKLDNFINCLKANYVDQMVASLLTPDELVTFKASDFYMRERGIVKEVVRGLKEVLHGPKEVLHGPKEVVRGPAEVVHGPKDAEHGPKGQSDSSCVRTQAPGSLLVQIARFHDELLVCQGTCPSSARLLELEATVQRLAELVETQQEMINLLSANQLLNKIKSDTRRRTTAK